MSGARAALTELPAWLWTVPGWLFAEDVALFEFFLRNQRAHGPAGDVVELGVYLGKSAIVMGRHVGTDVFTVLDLFEQPADSPGNRREVQQTYPDLTRSQFVHNYLRFHEHLPAVIQANSGDVLSYLAPETQRFIHVDASHLHHNVAEDLRAARTLLVPGGLVVVDDYRSAHAPGVAAAVWEAVATQGLRPLVLTDSKFYGTWGDPGPLQSRLRAWAPVRGEFAVEVQQIHGQDVLRLLLAPGPRPLRFVQRCARSAVLQRAGRRVLDKVISSR